MAIVARAAATSCLNKKRAALPGIARHLTGSRQGRANQAVWLWKLQREELCRKRAVAVAVAVAAANWLQLS